ncbi:MAG: thioredoxin-like domain-containing protein [Verrucomicrobiota bacterium JB022]|nr:thioredoxin-like domain-containing protein [Verrucomicrobiota bacterium JB022]
MKPSRAPLPGLILFALVAGLLPTVSAVESPVETTMLAPLDALSVQIEPSGRVSAVVRQGSRMAVSIDGEVGPRFDRFLGAKGQPMIGRSQFPAVEGQDKLDHPVLFSPDGKRHAYIALQGEEYVVVVDGKEVHRGAYSIGTIGSSPVTIQFSPQGKHYWFIASHEPKGKDRGYYLFMDGKLVPERLLTRDATAMRFSEDDSRYALLVGRGNLIVNGKATDYSAYPHSFLPNGKLVSVNDSGTLLDGKVLHPQLRQPVVSSTGRVAGVVSDGVWLDGKILPGTDGAETVQFSPDGKRVVVHGRASSAMWQWLDGKRSPNYQSFKAFEQVDGRPVYARFTADSSRCISLAFQGGLLFPLVNGEESDGYEFVDHVTTAPVGGRFGYKVTKRTRASAIVIDDREISAPEWRTGNANTIPSVIGESFTFSPDGKRTAFSIGSMKQSAHFIDGKAVDLEGEPALAWTDNTFTSTDRRGVIFSPDSKHTAYVTGDFKTYHVRVDGQPIWSSERGVRSHPMFTPDSQHLLWFHRERAEGRKGSDEVVYSNGQRIFAMDLQRPPNDRILKYVGAVKMGDDGKLRIIAGTPEGILRHTIIPPRDFDLQAAMATGVQASAPVAAASTTKTSSIQIGANTVMAEPVRVEVKPAPTAAVAVAVEPLEWRQLVRQREAWPQTATLQRELRFADGAVVREGSEIEIVELKGNEVVARGNRGRVMFSVEADATNVLETANTAWAALTPEQRELTYRDLPRRPELWPYHVKLKVPLEFSGAPSMAAGDEVIFLRYDGRQLFLRSTKSNLAFNLEPENTDLFERSRDNLANGGARGRLVEELEGKLVDPANGRRSQLATEQPEYVVAYMGAGWCPPCRVFAPKLMATLKDAAPDAQNVAFVYVSGDKSAREAKDYTSSLGIDWPMLSFTSRDQLPAFEALFGDSIPQLVVTDRHGTVVIDSAKVGQDKALAQLAELF